MSDDNYWDDFEWIVTQIGKETEVFPTKEAAMTAHPEYTWDNFCDYEKELYLYQPAFRGRVPCHPNDLSHPRIKSRRKENK